AVAAGSLINLATILYLNSIRVPAVAAYVICAFFSFQVLIGIIKVKRFDQRERIVTGRLTGKLKSIVFPAPNWQRKTKEN
ncbi:hypothetical protein Gotri_023777, partial [Gossypium trilobum]|nr:hypothetical protein [Gossypium trilobum]MBA0794029.1 hypothetical protein [Gossypium harknessii]MBA0824584.1 hypothetical protein [Gossypium armourianum]